MKTLKKVDPYRVKYRIWDSETDTIEFETDDFDELCAVYYANYAGTTYREDTHPVKYSWYAYGEIGYVYRFAIKTEFGDILDNRDLSRPRRRYKGWDNPRHVKSPDVRYKKGNPNKIKRGYYNHGWWWEDDDYYEHPYKIGCFRQIYTSQERRQNAYHVDDYGPEVVRGRRRGYNLPSSWDDPHNSSWDTVKSWKHHSKRRHQWKVKE